jgi:hypothetical protein
MKYVFLIGAVIFIVGCVTLAPAPWTCPATENAYDSSNPPDNSVCAYNADTGALINATN